MYRNLSWGGALSLARIAFLFAAVALVLWAMPAFAQTTDGTITIPWGAWLGDVLDWSVTIILAVVAWALRQLPAGIYAIIQQLRAEQLLERAIDYGINAVKGASYDKQLDIPTTSAVIEAAAEYAVVNAPLLVQYLDPDTLRAKILARLAVEDGVTAEVVGATLP